MQEKMAALEGRKRLEDTLFSPALTDRDNVQRLVFSQLATAAASSSPSFSSASSSSSSSLHAHNNTDRIIAHETVQSRFELVWNLLELLRSASGEEIHNLAISGHDDTLVDGWKLKLDTGQLRVMYREGLKGTPYHTLLAEGFVNSPVTSALCLAWEAPSYGLWWPQMTFPMFKVIESRWIKRGFNGEDLSLIRVKVPWPLAAREILMCAFELEVFEEDLIIVLLHSLPDTQESRLALDSSDVSDVSSSVVRMELTGGFALQRLTSETSYFRSVANLDMKLDFVPPSIINFISRQLLGLGFKLYEKTLVSVNEEGSTGHFQKLIKTEPMYTRIREMLDLKKTERDMASRKEAAENRSSADDVPEALKSSKLEEIEGSNNNAVSFTQGEIAPASREEVPCSESRPNNRAGEQNSNAGVGVDPEVQRALEVLDKMISLVQSRKVGPMNNSILRPYKNDGARSSHGSPTHSVETTCSVLAVNGNGVKLQKIAPLEQVLQRTQGLSVAKQTSQIETKHKWFCFSFSPRCFG